MTIQEYLDAAMKATGSASYYQLSKAIGLSQARISDYRKKRIKPDEYACTRIALALGIDPVTVIGDIAIEFEKSAERRQWWQDFLRHAGKASAIAGTLVLIYFGSSPTVQAAGAATSGSTISAHYAQLARRTWRSTIRSVFNFFVLRRWTVYRTRPTG